MLDIEGGASSPIRIPRPPSPQKSTLSSPKRTGKRKFAYVEEIPDETLYPTKPREPGSKSKKQNPDKDSEHTEPEYFQLELAAAAVATTPRWITRSASGTPAPITVPKSKRKKKHGNVEKEHIVNIMTGIEAAIESVTEESGWITTAENRTQVPRTMLKSKKILNTDKEYKGPEYLVEMAAVAAAAAPRRTTRSASETPGPRTGAKLKTKKDETYRHSPLIEVETEAVTVEQRRTKRAASGAPAPPKIAPKSKKQKLGGDNKDGPLIEMDTGAAIVEPRRSTRAASGTPAAMARAVSGTPAPATGGKKVGRPMKKVVDVVLEEEAEDNIPASPVKSKGQRKKAK
jgi:hypothetical protein